MTAGGISVVVLSCGDLGGDVARRLTAVPGVRAVTLVTTPYRGPRTLAAKVRSVYRTRGLLGFAAIAWAKLARLADRGQDAEPRQPAPAGVPELRFADFHEPGCLAAMRDLAPDLGVVAGTYILKESVFSIPRLGSINLHSGKVPTYRGAAPGFWELYNGEAEVGITIHRVTTALDAGAIVAEAAVPLDSSPPGDPMTYLERFRAETLQPLGVRTLVSAVAAITAGTVEERPQPTEGARTYRTPGLEAVRELRHRVAARRRDRGT